MFRLISVSFLLLSALLSNAWAQPEEDKTPPATGVEATTAGTIGENKSGYEPNKVPIGGPNSVPAQLEDDDLVNKPAARLRFMEKALQPWSDWKRKINEQYGLQIGVDYTSLYLGASESLTGDRNAASGIFRMFGRWTLLGRGTENTGALVFNVNHRHKIGTDIVPTDLGSNVGYLGVTGSLFSDAGLVLVDLNWQQVFNSGQTGLIVGRYDPSDYIDVLGYSSPWKGFQNRAIRLNSSIGLPGQSYGIAAGTFIKDQWFVVGTVNDANGTIDDLEFFEDGSEFFSALEFGWGHSKENRNLKNVHVTYWHVDEREQKGIPESDGIAIGANWLINKEWLPFARIGWSDGLAPEMQKTITLGLGHYFSIRTDIIGLAVNWGDPSDEALREQYTTELFYSFQYTQNFAITPSVQWLVDPALNPDEDNIWIFGLRVRLNL
jgi:porin